MFADRRPIAVPSPPQSPLWSTCIDSIPGASSTLTYYDTGESPAKWTYSAVRDRASRAVIRKVFRGGLAVRGNCVRASNGWSCSLSEWKARNFQIYAICRVHCTRRSLIRSALTSVMCDEVTRCSILNAIFGTTPKARRFRRRSEKGMIVIVGSIVHCC